MSKHPYLLLISALGLGVIFDLLFWKQGFGINFPIFWIAVLATGIILLNQDSIRFHKINLVLIVLFIFFLVMGIVRSEPLSRFLAITGMLFILFTLSLTYKKGNWMHLHFGNYAANFFLIMAGILYLPVTFFDEVRKARKEKLISEGKNPASLVGRIIVGILISIPIIIILISLLASADSVFNLTLVNFFNNLGDAILQLFWILVIGYATAGILIFTGNANQDKNSPEKINNEVKSGPILGIVESSIVLGSISAVFLFFVFIQIKYFFGGNVNIGGAGFTYSEYARRGFNELNWVASISLIIVVILSLITHRDTAKQRKIFTGFNLLVIVQVIIILVSAFQRLLLAIDWHGFSRLRVYPLVFMIWMAVLLIGVAVLEMRQKEKFFTFAIVIASIGFSVSICTMNVDGIIGRYNVNRTLEDKHFNAPHLANLSSDLVPGLVQDFEQPNFSNEVHEGIGAALVCQQDKLDRWGDGKDWRSLDLSYILANNSLQSIKDELNPYELGKNEDGYYVKTPGGFKHQCVDTHSPDRED